MSQHPQAWQWAGVAVEETPTVLEVDKVKVVAIDELVPLVQRALRQPSVQDAVAWLEKHGLVIVRKA